MSLSFNQIIQQTKIDTVVGEQLLKDTEQFFKNNRVLINRTNEYRAIKRAPTKK